jgi:hypothetical protein
MSEWSWVALGFGVTYGAMGSYSLWLRHRLSAALRRAGQSR